MKKVINETRKTRSENKIDPNKKINIYLKTDSEPEQELISKELTYFDFLTRSLHTEIVEDFSRLPKGFRGVAQNWEILLPFNEEKDRINELDRLQKELIKITGQIDSIDKKLSNQEFLKKAPETVIANFPITVCCPDVTR